MRGFDALRAVLSALVLIVLAWVACELFDELAARSDGGDFPDALLCALAYASALIAWVWINFGNVLRR